MGHRTVGDGNGTPTGVHHGDRGARRQRRLALLADRSR